MLPLGSCPPAATPPTAAAPGEVPAGPPALAPRRFLRLRRPLRRLVCLAAIGLATPVAAAGRDPGSLMLCGWPWLLLLLRMLALGRPHTSITSSDKAVTCRVWQKEWHTERDTHTGSSQATGHAETQQHTQIPTTAKQQSTVLNSAVAVAMRERGGLHANICCITSSSPPASCVCISAYNTPSAVALHQANMQASS
jgi:hypothetical protein